MASKRTTSRRTSGKRRKVTKTELVEVWEKAQAQVANLLKDHGAGTLTQVDLKAGLEEIKEHLRVMEPHDWYYQH